jgi:PPOX class probable F420-dependent enzyme
MAEGHQADQLSEEIKALVRGANFGHLATLMLDGAPHIDPVWIDLEGETILVCSGTGSLKAKNTKRDPRIGLSVIAMDNPYKEAQIRGRIIEQRPDRDFAGSTGSRASILANRFRSGRSLPNALCW